MLNQREHRWSDSFHFWFGLVSLVFVLVGGIWHMSSRLTTIEQHVLTQSQRTETGFKHINTAIGGLNTEKSVFQSKIEQIYMKCCSELNASK